MSFSSEKVVKAVRKRRVCDGCNKHIAIGETAVNTVGNFDGIFYSYYYHPECRSAEIGLNAQYDRWDSDEWIPLMDAEREDFPWLKTNHPIAYLRLVASREQYATYLCKHDAKVVVEAIEGKSA